MAPRFKDSGFTLLETLVALLIVALGMMAVTTQLNRYIQSTIFIEEKSLASWVASNQATLMSVNPEWPSLGVTEIDVESFAGRDWTLEIEVLETPIQNLRRADIRVYRANNRDILIHSISALLEPPPPDDFPPLRWQPSTIELVP
jgi:general secretion pathway protein I